MDLARRDPEYMSELATHHVGGYLKVAPEHTDERTLELMKKPGADDFLGFDAEFKKASAAAGKKQYLIPYFIASHPGSDLNAMIDLALFLKRNHYKPRPGSGLHPEPVRPGRMHVLDRLRSDDDEAVQTAKNLKDRKMQRALLQFFKPENYFEVRQALEAAGRTDLIGDGCDCLISARAPKEALDRRRQQANAQLREHSEGDHIRGGPNAKGQGSGSGSNAPGKQGREKKSGGYRPQRNSQRRRERDR
jgi:hypothetical protein